MYQFSNDQKQSLGSVLIEIYIIRGASQNLSMKSKPVVPSPIGIMYWDDRNNSFKAILLYYSDLGGIYICVVLVYKWGPIYIILEQRNK